VAVSLDGKIALSRDSGASFALSAPGIGDGSYKYVSLSGDGQDIYLATDGNLYATTTSDLEMSISLTPGDSFSKVICSSDGSIVLALHSGGWADISMDYGQSWSSPSYPDGVWLDDIAMSSDGQTILASSDGYMFYLNLQPALTLPPDFLAPKTYGNPASVTGTAPAAPAVAITPTAPVITTGATSVIYNGVPQSATYSVDQKSSCSTTYNGSAIAPVQAGTYAVSITCSANSLTSTATTTLTITKAAPVISWSTPAAITSTTKLGASQLNAFSYIPGSFTYSASAGSTLPIGDDLITATFTPTDSTNYTTSTMTVTIHVTP
jgi:hypothetical protein